MRSTPWTAYTPPMTLRFIAFVLCLLIVLFAITLVAVGGFYLVRVRREYFRFKPFVAFDKKAKDALQAADLGWLAIICGPTLGLLMSLLMFTLWLLFGPSLAQSPERPMVLIVTPILGAIAGAITAGAFWTSSSLLGNVRKAAKRIQGIRDPEFDGPV
jgi:hypothetical protein